MTVLKIAIRELRGGLAGFWVLVLCLALGVGGIATIGTVRAALQQGLADESATLLGGDANLEFTYRYASEDERAWMSRFATEISQIVDFRSMIGFEETRTLVQVKAVDTAYPLYGAVQLSEDITLETALEDDGEMPGLIAAQALVDRLDLKIGDIVRLGSTDFVLRSVLVREPDSASAGFNFGPRVIVYQDALTESGLLATGTLFNSQYRLLFPADTNLAGMKTRAERLMADSGMRWQDSRNGARGLSRFVDRIGAFLILVGIAGLAVGGIGVSTSVRTYLDKKTETIATLKTLGATGNRIFAIYLLQISALAILGIFLGLVIGVSVPSIAAPYFVESLPIPVSFAPKFLPLLEAAIYGTLITLIFTIWPLARSVNQRAAGLYRDSAGNDGARPKKLAIGFVVFLSALLIGLATWFSGTERLALWSAAGIVGSLILLQGAAVISRRLTGRLAQHSMSRGKPAWRMALAAVAGPNGETSAVILSLGLGLTVLATIGQIETNMRRAINENLPDLAPNFFFIDIQKDQLAAFTQTIQTDEDVTAIETAPMLRGVITRINGEPPNEAIENHWIFRGDRGVTYASAPPKNGEIIAGDWWAEDYQGEPLVSFAAEEAEEIGLQIGDTITVNVLGRDILATVANFRTVDFENMEINFIMILNPTALAGAPHSSIATVYGSTEIERRLVQKLAQAFPNVTAINVRDAIGRVSGILEGIGAATRWGALATLLTGFVVLIGAAAASERSRIYEAAILKTVGAPRRQILLSFALRSALTGATAGIVAVVAAALSGWAIMRFVMEIEFIFNLPSALVIVIAGAITSMLAGLLFALRPLAARPAATLRARE